MTALSWAERRDAGQAALLLRDRVRNGAVRPMWIDATRFWYERRDEDGARAFRLVDAAAGSHRTLVHRDRIVAALAAHFGSPLDPADVILGNPVVEADARHLVFEAFGTAFRYDCAEDRLEPTEKRSDRAWLTSPDGRSALVARDANLWLRDIDGGAERPLTTDGARDNVYGAPPAAMAVLKAATGGDAPEAIWSPDSRWILTIQTDDRHVADLPIVDHAPANGVRPTVSENRVSLPGDVRVTEFRMIAIEVATGRQVEARYPRLNAVRMNSTPFGAGLAWWSADAATAYFVDIERGERRAHVIAFDVASGATRILFSDESESYVELSVNVYTRALIAPLPDTNEIIWYSERSGRGHFYLYDLATGALRHAVTAGAWQVRALIGLDARRRELLFLAGGIAGEENPYVCKPCAVSIDGGAVRVLSDTPGHHLVWRAGDMALGLARLDGFDPDRISGVSPGGDYFVETVSTVADPPVTSLRRRDGGLVCALEHASFDAPDGWQPPVAVRCTAADGETATYGLLFPPLGQVPGQRYPLIDYIYGGPQAAIVPHQHFGDGDLAASPYLEGAHLSALGAYVLILDGRGTAHREQAFRTASHRAAHTASNLEDHIAAIRQLAARYAAIDPDRVGITGFSGGGYMTAHAALRFGDMFKVAVAGGGNYDQALFWHSWGERYHGAYDEAHYAGQAARTYAAGMTGRLMLVHGLMDRGCHPAGLFQLVQALIEADKDPDLVILPRASHEWTGYGVRRRWDYFARHLIGEEPGASAAFALPFEDALARMRANAAPPAPRPTQAE